MSEVQEIAGAMLGSERKAMLRADEHGLTDSQSARGTLSNFGAPILDWSFRPAVFTPLGSAVRAHLQATQGEAG